MIVHIKENQNGSHPQNVTLHRLDSLIPEIEIYAESILQTVHESLLILSPDLRVMWANESFYKTFQVGPRETEGRLIFDLGNRQWDLSGLWPPARCASGSIPCGTHLRSLRFPLP